MVLGANKLKIEGVFGQWDPQLRPPGLEDLADDAGVTMRAYLDDVRIVQVRLLLFELLTTHGLVAEEWWHWLFGGFFIFLDTLLWFINLGAFGLPYKQM
jgi:hypothetical protein